MPDINLNEYGQVIRVDLGQGLSSATNLIVILEPKQGEKLTKDGTLGTSDIAVNDQTFLANQYIEYTTVEDDIIESGLYRIKGEATVGTARVIGDYRKITVLE